MTHAHTIPGFKIAVAPAASISHGSAHANLTLVNEGSHTLHVTGIMESYQRVHGRCVLTRADGSSWGHITPSHLTLAPNQEHAARVLLNVPKGARGQHDLLASFSAVASNGHVKVHGAVGSLLDVKLPGKSNACISLSAPVHHGGSPLVAIIVAVAVVAVLATVGVILRRRHNRKVAAS